MTTREMLTAVRIYYVRTDGNDANDGLSNTSGGAFLTIQRGIEACYTIDLGNYGAIIQVANGTYSTPQYTAAGTLLAPWVGGNSLNARGFGSPVTIRGDITTPSNVVINATDGAAFRASLYGSVNVEGMKFVVNSSGGAIYASAFGQIWITDAVDFGACAGDHMLANQNGKIIIAHNYYLSGNAYSHYRAFGGGSIETNQTVFVSGGVSMSTAFAWASTNGIISSGNSYTSMGVTGKTYDATLNAVIDSGGGGFPGSVNGTTATGGQYR